MRDGLMPFYAWTRFNLPLQLEMLVQSPQKFTRVWKGKNVIEDRAENPTPDEISEADWLKKTANVRLKYNDKTGNYEYFVMESWWPAADVGKMFSSRAGQELLNMMNPFPKVASELITGYSLFQPGRKIKGEFKGDRRKVLGIPLLPRVKHFLYMFRPLAEIDKTITYALEGERTPTSLFLRSLGRAFLGKIYPQNPEKQRIYWEAGIRNDIIKLKGKRKSATIKGDQSRMAALEKAITELEDYKEEQLSTGKRRRRKRPRSDRQRRPRPRRR